MLFFKDLLFTYKIFLLFLQLTVDGQIGRNGMNATQNVAEEYKNDFVIASRFIIF